MPIRHQRDTEPKGLSQPDRTDSSIPPKQTETDTKEQGWMNPPEGEPDRPTGPPYIIKGPT